MAAAEHEEKMANDTNFTVHATHGGMAEVKLGQMATEKATHEKVKAFGQRMVADHSKANEKLLDLAKRKNITVGKDLDEKHKNESDRLSKLSGAEFDREYMTMMVKDHRKTIKEFELESTKGQDPDIKSFAAETLKTLREHQQLANETAAAIGVKVPEIKGDKTGQATENSASQAEK